MIPAGSVPNLNVRSGGVLVAGMFLVGGFVRIFLSAPSPNLPAAQKSSVAGIGQPAESKPGADGFRAEIAQKIRDSYGCADSDPSVPTDPEASSWGVPAGSRASARFVIAFEPDPAHTHLAMFFDRNIEALELAVQHTGAYTFDRSILPWRPARSSKSGDSAKTDKNTQSEKYPGLLIFRKSEPPQPAPDGAEGKPSCQPKDALFVFLVAETPTSGIRTEQFHNALKIMRQIRIGAPASSVKQPLLILGPNFSGSLDSLRRQLLQILPEQNLSSVIIRSGTVSSASSIAAFRAAFPVNHKPPVSFESFQENDDYAIQMFTSFAASRGYCSNEIAILSEADTVYGNQERPGGRSLETQEGAESSCVLFEDFERKASQSNIVHLHFPREISFFRAAYEKELAAQAQSAVKVPNSKSALPVEMEDEGSDDDSVATFARGQTAQSQEAVMFGIVGELHKHHIKFTIVLATNPVDQVFLARFLRANYPQGRIVVTSPDLLLQNQDDSLLYGVLGLNSYSLVPGIGDSFCLPVDGAQIHADQLFDSSSSIGVFNAATALLFTDGNGKSLQNSGLPRPVFHDYASPAFHDGAGCIARPALWLTILGRDGFWPIAALADSDVLPDPQLAEPTLPVVSVKPIWNQHTSLPTLDAPLRPPASSPLHTRPPWNVIYGLCVLLIALHAYFSLTGSFLSNSESKAQFSRTGDTSAAIILAIGAFWLCMALTLLLCTRSLRIEWDNVWPIGITMLLWLPLPVFIILTTYDLLKRCDKPAIAYSFLGTTLFFTAFQILLASGSVPGLQYVWSTRLIHITSGVSPIFPFLLFFAGGYWWAWFSLRGVSIIDLRRPRLPAVCSLPPSAVRISETEGEKVRATAHPLALRARVAGSLAGVFL
ncbi:MAG TPA: hypothetical protein VFP96_05005, partial [Candidatus Acidoferrum sp.]|nr:hypothetical protein [Candidatus Acidoferrum sp.]